jgi:hypothetical protein
VTADRLLPNPEPCFLPALNILFSNMMKAQSVSLSDTGTLISALTDFYAYL